MTNKTGTWREACRKLQDAGVEFESDCGNNMFFLCGKDHLWAGAIFNYRIAQQPIPDNIGELIMQENPEPKEEIPHRELQIQWHEDKLESLKNKTPMREWQWKNEDGEWGDLNETLILKIGWFENTEYRRKPKTRMYEFYWCMLQSMHGIRMEWRDSEAELKDIIQNSPAPPKQLTTIKKETVEIEVEE